jgi:sugar phosphate isomerase/epimerase
MARWRIGIFARTFPGTEPEAVLAAVRDAGCDCAQFNLSSAGLPPMPDAVPPGTAGRIAAAARATSVGLAALSGTYNMIHPDPAVRALGLRRLEPLLACAAALGAPLVTLCTGTRDPEDQWRHHPDNRAPEAWRDLLAEMGKALDLAERHGVDLGVEPELANVVASAGHAARLLAELRSPRLRIVLDPANLFETTAPAERRRIIDEAVDLLGPHVAMAHAKDRDAEGGLAAAGSGVVEFDRFLRRLREAGFDGPLVAHGLAAAEAPAVAAFLREQLRRAAGP